MSQHNSKHIIPLFFLAVLTVAFSLTGCRDDVLYNYPTDIPDAEVELSADLMFKPLDPIEIKTRATANGDSYKGIDNLYVFFFSPSEDADADQETSAKLIMQYSDKIEQGDGENQFKIQQSEDGNIVHATFKKRVQAGKYFIYAVCNISETEAARLKKPETTIRDLRNFKLTWDDNIATDQEMFGVFTSAWKEDPDEYDADKDNPNEGFNKKFEDDRLLTITPDNRNIHSWVRRAVSKVTIDFDGSGLKEDVTVRIISATLKDVASHSRLGANSKVGDKIGETDVEYGNYDYVIDYGDATIVTKTSNPTPPSGWNLGTAEPSFHDDKAQSLPCYENRQENPEGKKKFQDNNNDGIIDSEFVKDGISNGTYLEVTGYYKSTRPEYKSEGNITYRFMLGQNERDNFDLIRNHHYKVTMNFKGYGNDVDWHIVYNEKFLDVSYPEDVNYQGKFFVPSQLYTDPTAWPYNGEPNAGHDFSDENVISITSFSTGNNGEDKKWVAPDEENGITYSYKIWDEKTNDWIDATKANEMNWLQSPIITGEPAEGKKESGKREYTFKANMSNPIATKISDMFAADQVGSKESPINLGKEETANCYIVNASGWYSIPLVYGNGKIHNSVTNGKPHFVNHKGASITDKSIKNTLGGLNNVSVKLIWQDAEDLIDKDQIEVDKTNEVIKFYVKTIQEGNAIIALIDDNAEKPDAYLKGENTKAIWSWHIWATPLFSRNIFSGQFQETIRVTNNSEQSYDVMPVNLGWCSGGKNILYYPPRKCEITFKFGSETIKREIIQYPHIVLPRGDHPYYQWGRKDPFVGTNVAFGNKTRYNSVGTAITENPARLYNEPVVGDGSEPSTKGDERRNTVDCLPVLVQNPDKWHNSTRMVNEELLKKGSKNPFNSTNESFSDLWSCNGEKTVYDPCPPGFQVGDETVFAGFVIPKDSYEKNPVYWNDVLESDMTFPSGYDYNKDNVNCFVIEFYTDSRKLQSITFPVSGYRDYDERAEVLSYYNPESTTHLNNNSIGFVWTNKAVDKTNSMMLKYQRAPITGTVEGKEWKERAIPTYIGTDADGKKVDVPFTNEMGISPFQKFYNTDGFAVRPVKIK